MQKAQNSRRNSQPKASAHAAPLTAFRALLRRYRFAPIVLLALSAASCRSAKTMQTEQSQAASSDSVTRTAALAAVTTVKTWAESVQADTARLTLRLDSICALPIGAVFTQRKGRVTVTLGKADGGNAIQVTAAADSIPRRVQTETKTAQAITATATKAQSEQRTDSVRQTYGRRTGGALIFVLLLLVAETIAIIIIKRK